MSWSPTFGGVSADGSHAFTVDRQASLIPVPKSGHDLWLWRRRWRVRVWRTEPEEELLEAVVKSPEAAEQLLRPYSLEWNPPPNDTKRRLLPGL